MMNWLKIISFGSFLFGWLQRASADGKITWQECIELVQEAAEFFGLDIEIDLTDDE